MNRRTLVLAAAAAGLLLRPAAPALTVRVSPQALERTLQKQLFKGPEGRYFLKGHGETGCYIYAEDPKVSFRADRVVVHVRTRARLGTAMHGSCLGIGLSLEADVSLLPEAQGETIGFRDPRIENLGQSRDLNLFLEPFLSRKLPQQMKLNAADLLREALANSVQSTGYDLKLLGLKLHSMQVSQDALVVDLDGDLDVR